MDRTALLPRQEPVAARLERAPRRSRLGLLWGAAAVVALLLSPLALQLAAWLPACPFRTLTGIPCPGCGTTRAALLLASLDPWTALVRYPLPSLLWLLFLVGGAVTGLAALLGFQIGDLAARMDDVWASRLRWAAVTALVANWLYAIGTGV